MVVIRLARVGKKKQPEYRIVVADKRRAATGRFIDIIGHYNPLPDPAHVQINSDKFMEWLQKGAQPSDTVRRLFDRVQAGEEIKNKPKKRKKDSEPVAASAKAEEAAESTEEEVTSEETTEPAEEAVAEEPNEAAPAPEVPEATPDAPKEG